MSPWLQLSDVTSGNALYWETTAASNNNGMTSSDGAASWTAYGEDFVFELTSHVVAAPEPASVVLLATGLLGVFGAARRRKQ